MSGNQNVVAENIDKGKMHSDSSIVELEIIGINLNTDIAKQIGFSYMLKNDLDCKKCYSCIHRDSEECAEIKKCIYSQCGKYSKDDKYVNSLYIPNNVVINKIK